MGVIGYNIEYIVVSITGFCNMSCKGCFRVDRNSQMSVDTFRSLHPLFEKMGVKYVNFTGGEPLCNLDVIEMLRISKSWGYTNILSTNGVLFNDVNIEILNYVDILAVSLDGDNHIVNDMYRISGHFDNTMRLIDRVYNEYPNVSMKINTLVTSQNKDHVIDIGSLLYKFREHIKCWKLFQISSRGSENRISESDKVSIEDFHNIYHDARALYGDSFQVASLEEDSPNNYCIIRCDGSLNTVINGQYYRVESVDDLHFQSNSYEATSLGI